MARPEGRRDIHDGEVCTRVIERAHDRAHTVRGLDRLWARATGAAPPELGDDTWPELVLLERRRRAGEGPDWTAAVAHIGIGEEYRSQGRLREALGEYAMAFAYTAPALDLTLYILIGLSDLPDLPAAERWGRQIIAAGVRTIDAHTYLALAVWKLGRHDEALDICSEMVARFPTEQAAVTFAAQLFLERERPRQALSACFTLAEAGGHAFASWPQLAGLLARASIASRTPLPTACLAGLCAAAEGEQAPGALREAAAMLALDSAVQSAWSAFFSPADRGDAPSLPRDPDALARILAAWPAPRVVDIASDAARAHYGSALRRPDVLEAEGFALRSFETIAALQRWSDHPAAPDPTSQAPVRRMQLKMIADGALTLLSPFGDAVTTASSFVLNYHPGARNNGSVIAYAFLEPRPLFAIFSTEQLWPVAWYDPVASVLMVHSAITDGGFRAYLQLSVRELQGVMLADVEATRTYLARDARRRGEPPWLLVGALDFLSSHLLDLQGILALRAAGQDDRVARVVMTAPEPLGPLEYYAPELRGRIERPSCADLVELNAYLMRRDAFSCRITGGVIEDGIVAAVRARAHALTPEDWRDRVACFVAATDLTVFVSLRTRGRRWLADPADIAALFAGLQESCGHLGLIIDGYSSANGDTPAQSIADDAAYMAPILRALPATVSVLVAAGRPIEEAIVAAEAADIHLSAQGTSATKGLLLAGKPGVVIGPRQFGLNFRDLRFPPPPTVSLRANADDLRDCDLQTDFRLEPHLVLAALRSVATGVAPQRPQDPRT